MAESLDDYKSQLEMIESALQADPDNGDLQQLQSDLNTLIQLMAEPGPATEPPDPGPGGSSSSLSEDLEKLSGLKVRALVSTAGNCAEYGNAVISSVEEVEADYQETMVRLVFSHPTLERLVPCKYYLEGRCSRTQGCRWSHGELRRLGDLTAWREPEGEPGQGSPVLARDQAGVWRRGVVTDILRGDFLVRLDVGGGEPELRTEEEIFLLEAEEDSLAGPSEEVEVDQLPELQTFVPTELGVSGVKFGDWESSTRGLGSRLMLKMGWVVGSGLGRRGEGRVEPVTARLYPSGKSLDWCMEMRDKYGDSGLVGDVEKIMKKEAKEAARKSKQSAEAAERRDNSAKSLFDFINVNLGNNHQGETELKKENKGKSAKGKTSIRDETDADIKLKKFKMSEQVSRLEKEISKLTESHTRLVGKDPTVALSVSNKLEAKRRELYTLKTAEKKLNKEEGSRKSKSKLTIF